MVEAFNNLTNLILSIAYRVGNEYKREMGLWEYSARIN